MKVLLCSEELIERFTRAVKENTSLPVLAKLTPNVMDMVPMALAVRRGWSAARER